MINQPAQIIGNRYILQDQLGTGGMGSVYRAVDRLTGQTVALKRVHLEPEQLAFNSRDESSEPTVALAHEFQTLASLRHPNIISVLDYGFITPSQPYFTMMLLENARDIRAVAKQRDLIGKVDLLIQMLQALAYLHRRGVVHRDIKPGNVLVAGDGQVKLLDFGLSIVNAQTSQNMLQTFAGTFGYTAPEVFMGEPVGRSADLYAVGIIAYEMFSGEHPFDLNNLGNLVMEILNKYIDVYHIGLDDRIADVLDRLITKNRDRRYRDAQDVIRDLCLATGQPVPEESSAIRESFLQAAQLVGRETEIERLISALKAALAGQGSAWLMGGESGVGKSRLMHETRTQALVQGALVLTGQSLNTGGLSYQMWRDPVRRLIISGDITDQEASVLKEIVPDISDLLDRDIADPPVLEARLQQQRLMLRILDLFKRQKQPVLLLLEDLHWAWQANLEILKQLVTYTHHLPLMIIASYRDDARPNLPADLPGMQVMKLERLSRDAIAQLGYAMLGESARREEVIDLLQRETAGNAFFLVEVVRALAENAGRLEAVGQQNLPEQVFAEGVQSVVRWRLERVPDWGRSLLNVAAAAGHRLDLAVLRRFAPLPGGFSLEEWLTLCANVAVLELRDERWQFVHDKLREGLLDDLEADARARLHFQVARAIENVYGSNLIEHAFNLANHYHAAGDRTRERYFAVVAAQQAMARYSIAEAADLLGRALALTPQDDVEITYQILSIWEKVYDLQGMRDSQLGFLDTLEALANQLDDDRRRTEVALRRAQYNDKTSSYAATTEDAQRAVALAHKLGLIEYEVEARYWWGHSLYRQGRYAEAQTMMEQAQAQASIAALPHIESNCLRTLGAIAARLGDYRIAQIHFERCRDMSRQINDRRLESWALGNLGYARQVQGDYVQARAFYSECLDISREIGDIWAEINTLINLAMIGYERSDYDDARRLLEQSLYLSHESGDRQNESESLYNLGRIAHALGDYSSAHDMYTQALQIFREIGNRLFEGWTLAGIGLLYFHLDQDAAAYEYARQALDIASLLQSRPLQVFIRLKLAHILVVQGRFDEAGSQYQQALLQQRELGQEYLTIEPLAGLARLHHLRGEYGAALQCVDELLSKFEPDRTDGLEEIFEVYLTCYGVLKEARPQQARSVLSAAYQLLQSRAEKIADPAQRRSFLNTVSANRTIAAAWKDAFSYPST